MRRLFDRRQRETADNHLDLGLDVCISVAHMKMEAGGERPMGYVLRHAIEGKAHDGRCAVIFPFDSPEYDEPFRKHLIWWNRDAPLWTASGSIQGGDLTVDQPMVCQPHHFGGYVRSGRWYPVGVEVAV